MIELGIGMAVFLGIGLLIVVAAGFVWLTYNGLVSLRVKVDEAWSDITVQLKRRLDLIPNLIETVKGYAAHESTVFENVTRARAEAMQATGVEATANAENQLEGALKSLFAVSESYPDLKASANFMELQKELIDTEDKIQAARRFYNNGVMQLNTKIQMFPNNFVAQMFKFDSRAFFELDEAEQKRAEQPVEVKF